uniref:Leucine-rich repeat-containing protein 15-like n=1 Tax=Saccoglossus kowalevskii TaxID=10224 RepID=A0ABM0M8P4_SACKO|nr:PREDICTED: leucine-rich repeat-containing protein 15-like [Saccoglossus kowalevskii]
MPMMNVYLAAVWSTSLLCYATQGLEGQIEYSLTGGACNWDNSAKLFDCSHRQLHSIPHNHSSDTVKLFLNNNLIQSVSSNDFQDLPNLKTLFLDSNKISHIDDDSFSRLLSLTHLRLSDNPLRELSPALLQPLQNLETLKLSSIELTFLPDGVFSGLSKLRELVLRRNVISQLSPGIFADLSNLYNLDLFDNSIGTLQSSTFQGLIKLSYLELSDNDLFDLREGCFDGLAALDNLDMNYNDLEVIPTGTLSSLVNLGTLQLSHNRLREIPPDVGQLRNLIELRIDDNLMGTVSSDNFVGLRKLYSLHLSDNLISSVDTLAFYDLHNLKELKLDSNRLTYIHPDVFVRLYNLELLWLDDNQLSMLFTHSLKSMPLLSDIRLSNNIWNCNCSFLETVDYIQRSALIEITDDVPGRCVFPVELRLTPLTNLGGHSMKCNISATSLELITVKPTVMDTPTYCEDLPIVLGICLPITVLAVASTIVMVVLWRRRVKMVESLQERYVQYSSERVTYVDFNGSKQDRVRPPELPREYEYAYTGVSSDSPENARDYDEADNFPEHTYHSLRSDNQLESADGYLVVFNKMVKSHFAHALVKTIFSMIYVACLLLNICLFPCPLCCHGMSSYFEIAPNPPKEFCESWLALYCSIW